MAPARRRPHARRARGRPPPIPDSSRSCSARAPAGQLVIGTSLAPLRSTRSPKAPDTIRRIAERAVRIAPHLRGVKVAAAWSGRRAHDPGRPPGHRPGRDRRARGRRGLLLDRHGHDPGRLPPLRRRRPQLRPGAARMIRPLESKDYPGVAKLLGESMYWLPEPTATGVEHWLDEPARACANASSRRRGGGPHRRLRPEPCSPGTRAARISRRSGSASPRPRGTAASERRSTAAPRSGGRRSESATLQTTAVEGTPGIEFALARGFERTRTAYQQRLELADADLSGLARLEADRAAEGLRVVPLGEIDDIAVAPGAVRDRLARRPRGRGRGQRAAGRVRASHPRRPRDVARGEHGRPRRGHARVARVPARSTRSRCSA